MLCINFKLAFTQFCPTNNQLISLNKYQDLLMTSNSISEKTIPINIVIFGLDDGSGYPFTIKPICFDSTDMNYKLYPNFYSKATYYDFTKNEIPVAANEVGTPNSNYYETRLNKVFEQPLPPTGLTYFNSTSNSIYNSFQICNPQSLTNSKVKFKINHYYFYRSTIVSNATNLSTTTSAVQRAFNYHSSINNEQANKVLTVYICNSLLIQNAYGEACQIIGTNGDILPAVKSLNSQPGWWIFKEHLPHELGHHFGLKHTYENNNQNNTSSNEFLDDIYSCNPIIGLTNNIMGGRRLTELSPKQAAFIHSTLETNQWQIDYIPNSFTNYSSFAYGYSPIPHAIYNDEVWDFFYKSYNDIVIKKGATLTIKCRLEMVPEAKIVVEQGGRLVIDGATITSARNAGTEHEGLWKGIEVWGDPSKSQTALDPQGNKWQGIVEMKNGATIENAYVGIITNNNTTNAGGGILDLQNSTFRNCWKSVQVQGYPNYNNIGIIKRCTFETTNMLPNGLWPAVFIDGYQFRGLKIYGNTFEFKGSGNSPMQIQDQGIGILFENSKALINGITTANISDYCDISNQNWIPNRFIGLNKGIVLRNISNLQSNITLGTTINKNYFTKCIVAIENNGMPALTITQNRIELGNNQTPFTSNNEGIINRVGTGFKIEGNCIETLNSNFNFASAIVVQDAGGDNNFVYRNTSIGNQHALLSNGKNRTATPTAYKYRGLQFLCNSNTDNNFNQRYDIAVATNLGSTTDPMLGVRYYQGGNGTNNSPKAAANTFTSSIVGAEHDIYNNTLNPIVYFFNSANSAEIPTSYSGDVSISIGQDNQCPSSLGIGIGGPIGSNGYTQLLSNYAVHNGQFLATAILYNQIIDGGNTQSLLQTITNNSNLSGEEIKEMLLNLSPNVSEEVMRKFADGSTYLTNADLLTIIAANPDVALSEELLYMLQNKANPMDEWMIDFLRDAGMYETNRTLLEQSYAQKQFERDADVLEIVRYMLNDTLSDTLNHAELRSWLSVINSPRAKYMIADDYISCGNYDAALQLVSAMNERDLDRYEIQERNGMIEWYNMLNRIHVQNMSIFEARDELQQLRHLAENITENGLAGMLAANALNKYNKDNYILPVIYPNNSTERMANTKPKKQRVIKKVQNFTSQEKKSLIDAFPNPADKQININISNIDGSSEINIIDSKGELVMKKNIIDEMIISFSTSDLSNGLYSCKILNKSGIVLKTIKVIVLHK
jgi:hypothetical protein